MLGGFNCILYSIDSYLYVSCSGSITSVGEERAKLSAIVYLFREVSSSSGCLGWAALFYCGTHTYFVVIARGRYLSVCQGEFGLSAVWYKLFSNLNGNKVICDVVSSMTKRVSMDL